MKLLGYLKLLSCGFAFLALGMNAWGTGFRSPAGAPPVEALPAQIVGSDLVHEDWKWPADPAEAHFGFLMGLGILDSSAGFTILGTASKKILHEGFIPEINNSVSLEVMGGPLFVQDSRSFAYSTHLRWDFRRDGEWTVYALGGFGGNITSAELGDRFLFLPRFGVGALKETSLGLVFRGEFSHEFVTFGLAWPI